MYYFFIFLIFNCLFSLTGCSDSSYLYSPPIAQYGKIIDLKTQQQISFEQLLSELAQTDHILVGEEHDNLHHHKIEQYLISRLEQIRPLKAIILEMLDISQQSSVTHLQLMMQQGAFYSPNTVKQEIHWHKWDWAMYQDLIMASLANQKKLIAANLTEAEIKQIMQGAQPLQGNLSTQTSVQQKIGQLIQSHHFFKPHILEKQIQIQQFRDRRMAEMLQKSNPLSLLIAGNHHVQKDIGVPLHLVDFYQQKRTPFRSVSLMLKSADEKITFSQADYVWLTH